MNVQQFATEIIAGLILLFAGLAFRQWAAGMRAHTGAILSKLDSLAHELHAHRIANERRLTRVERDVHYVSKALKCPSHGNDDHDTG
jgi:hypothetical protein